MTRTATLDIVAIGQRGEGIAVGPVYIPYALPGERVVALVEGERGERLDLLRPSPDRIAPICPYFGTCGGCAVQSLAPAPYAAWKRDLVAGVLARARLSAEVRPVVDAHGAGRRRVTVHARAAGSRNLLAAQPPLVGFMRARAHEIVTIEACPILEPGLAGALPAARALAGALAPVGKPLDIQVTATRGGLDVDIRGCGPLDRDSTAAALAAATAHDVARLSNHGEVLIERRVPVVRMGRADVVIPPKSFLQATERGEAILAAAVLDGIGAARQVLDLFCGVGPFALRLAERATVHAVDQEEPALAALAKAARAAQAGLRPISVERRDLFRRPVAGPELDLFEAVVFDPPRVGAAVQAEALAASRVPTVVAVSCNPATFARDAATLAAGGYTLESVTPVDQFRYAAHIELVGVFRRATPKAPRKRSLLG